MGYQDSKSVQFCIGVTGHRKIPDATIAAGAVKTAIDSEIDRLRTTLDRETSNVRAPHISLFSPIIQLSILSPLAEGADRLVARVVLSYPGAKLKAVLPLALEDYMEDFQLEESKYEFTNLFRLCEHPITLRTQRIREEQSAPEAQEDLRRDAYLRVGQYVVDHCDLLIALWDGEPSRGRGGTADIVQYARERNRRALRIWKGKYEMLIPGSALTY
jgi:hypothetical protein